MNFKRSSARFGKDRRSVGKLTGRFAPRATIELGRLKEQLLRDLLDEFPGNARTELSRAADEAASVAWATPYPFLVLPELINEKARAALRQLAKQRNVFARSQSILWMAA